MVAVVIPEKTAVAVTVNGEVWGVCGWLWAPP